MCTVACLLKPYCLDGVSVVKGDVSIVRSGFDVGTVGYGILRNSVLLATTSPRLLAGLGNYY